MRKKKLVLLALAAGATSITLGTAGPAHAMHPTDESVHSCLDRAGAKGDDREGGEDTLTAHQRRVVEARTDARLERKGWTHSSARSSIQIPVYFHKMLASNGAGNVTDQQIADQIQVMNDDFAGLENTDEAANTGFTFKLAGVDTYKNDTWHVDGDSENYRTRTRKGGKAALNIWLVDAEDYGVATFPYDYPREGAYDGVRLRYSTLPGGTATPYDLGDTAVHETGHWLGLWHTFEGGCSRTNDKVSDTPAQESDSRGCPTGRDSCTAPGLDPIHNYMDYSDDSCYDQFTPGQNVRMHDMWTAWRA